MIALLAALAGATDTPTPTPPEPDARLRIEAVTEPRHWSPALAVLVHDDAGAPIRLPLVRDDARQGFYAAQLDLPARRYRDVELILDDDTSLWRRVVPADHPDALTVSFLVEQEGPRAARVAWLPVVGGGQTAGNEVALALAFGWGALCFGYVGWLARARRGPA